MMAYVWMDCERRYFISTASSLQDGNDHSIIRWRQPDLPEEDFGGVNNEESERAVWGGRELATKPGLDHV